MQQNFKGKFLKGKISWGKN